MREDFYRLSPTRSRVGSIRMAVGATEIFGSVRTFENQRSRKKYGAYCSLRIAASRDLRCLNQQ